MKNKISKILMGVIIATSLATPIYADTLKSMDIKTEVSNTEVKNTNAAVNLSDISNHWGRENIEYLIQRGAISGYPDGTFKPNKTISRAEFVAIALKSAKNGQIASQVQGSHWATNIFLDALDNDVLMIGEMPETSWDQPISRYEMTMVMIRLTENVINEDAKDTSGVARIMADYSEVSKQQEYKYYVEQAFMKGLISGRDTMGTFDGKAGATRAEASTVVAKMLAKEKRNEVNVDKVQPGAGTVLNQTDANRPNPKLGDTFVKSDGTQVVLKVGPSGVLGEGQGVSLYEGMKYPNGDKLKHGDLGREVWGYFGQTYLVDERTGEGHFRKDWGNIREYEITEARKIVDAKEGQMSGNYCQFIDGDWYWIGPINRL
ncbi:S-layer homology domain-containing protein [Lutibacter sp. B2]|nr:S-layer homology domain-containing protein [Lutibacter sp. B2]